MAGKKQKPVANKTAKQSGAVVVTMKPAKGVMGKGKGKGGKC